MCPSCTVQKKFKETKIEGSLKVATNNNCNYVECRYNLLLTVECSDTSCNNWFHHMCQYADDNSKYNNEFDIMHNLKKHCKIFDDKLVESFVNSIHKEKGHNNLMQKKPNVPNETSNKINLVGSLSCANIMKKMSI